MKKILLSLLFASQIACAQQVTFQQAGTGSASASLGSLAPAYPVAGLNSGDLFIMFLWSKASFTTNLATFSDWVPAIFGTVGTDFYWGIYYKIASGAESGNVTVGFTTDPATVKMARIFRFRNTVNPSFSNHTIGFGTDNTIELPTISATQGNSLLVSFIAVGDDNTIAAATGATGATYTEPTPEFTTSAGTDGCLGINIATIPSATTVSGGVINMGNGSSDPWFAFSFILNSANPPLQRKVRLIQ
jgi:hypothetical protein